MKRLLLLLLLLPGCLTWQDYRAKSERLLRLSLVSGGSEDMKEASRYAALGLAARKISSEMRFYQGCARGDDGDLRHFAEQWEIVAWRQCRPPCFVDPVLWQLAFGRACHQLAFERNIPGFAGTEEQFEKHWRSAARYRAWHIYWSLPHVHVTDYRARWIYDMDDEERREFVGDDVWAAAQEGIRRLEEKEAGMERQSACRR